MYIHHRPNEPPIPERLAQFIQQADNEALLEQMAILLPGLGKRAIDMILTSCFSGDPQASANAGGLLMKVIAGCKPYSSKKRRSIVFIDASPIHIADEVRGRLKWPPIFIEDLDNGILNQLIERTATFLDHQTTDIRNKALRILGLFRRTDCLEQIKTCLSHPELSTRLAALLALADIGGGDLADLFIQASLEGSVVERCAAIEAFSRLGIDKSLPILKRMVDDPNTKIQRAAITALGEMSNEDTRSFLDDLLQTGSIQIRKYVAKALYRSHAHPAPLKGTLKRLQKLRGDARPFAYISMDTAIRYAFPELRQYDERELTRRIGEVCYDYSATRRYLMDEGLMSRTNRVCEFTDRGKTVWRVEHFIMENYLKSTPDTIRHISR